jgi:hypothetical protein
MDLAAGGDHRDQGRLPDGFLETNMRVFHKLLFASMLASIGHASAQIPEENNDYPTNDPYEIINKKF